MLRRYETIRFHLLRDRSGDIIEVENIDEVMEDVRDIVADGINNTCIGGFNSKREKAMNMKTANGKANSLIKFIKYYEDNIEKIPGEILGYTQAKDAVASCKQAISDIKNKNNEWVAIINEAGVKIPDGWKKDWKEELPE